MIDQIYKRYLYACKSFSAHAIIGTIKLILHKILISTKCLNNEERINIDGVSICPQNELVAKRFLSKFYQFTNQKFQLTIKWISKKVKSLFSLKDKNPYPA